MGSRELLFAFCLFVFALSSARQALALDKGNSIKALTDANISEFIEDTSILTSNQNIDRNDSEVTAYLDRHIDKKARFRTSITYNMPGLPGTEKVLTLKKQDYIEQVNKGADSVDHYHSDIEIESVKISKNKKTASVNTVTTESGIMKLPAEDGSMEEVPIEGESRCFQVLKLSKKGYIQMHSANCVTIMNFLSN